ncbi:MAG: flavodoxin family protein [Lachnospiraceae bacterium]|nr:flavodoxin family protein [Lachnospiraceae bacterium]
MEKKKILAIQGSYKNNGITSSMLNYAVDESKKAGHDVEYIRFHDHRIEYCKGCRKCFATGECIIKDDDMTQISKSIKNADVIILACPVYWANVPAIVKNLFDRMSGTSMEKTNTFPKPRLSGRRYILLTACNTPMTFAALCGQTTGLKRVVKEYFKTSGISCIGIVACDNTSKQKGVPSAKLNQIQRLIRRI